MFLQNTGVYMKVHIVSQLRTTLTSASVLYTKNLTFKYYCKCPDLNNKSALIVVGKRPLHDVTTSTAAGSPAHV
jgi:hypothetical protein